VEVVQLNSVKKNFDTLSVLKGLDLSLTKGEVLGLFGHNGAGKTTVIKMILGLLEPSSGEVKVFDQNPCNADFSHHRYHLGFLPENVSFYPQLSGLEVLQFFAKLKKVSQTRCIELLHQVGLYEARSRKVKHYSKGMKQRLGLAQAILSEPSLLLLDEPTVGLDPIATQDFYQITDELRQKGCSIILCSHVLPGVEKHIDKAAILSQGELRAYGSIKELRKQTHLKTQITFSGYFELEALKQKLDRVIDTNKEGSFTVEVHSHEKVDTLKILMMQPGILDLDTKPPSLEQLYRFFIENDQTITASPQNTKTVTNIQAGALS